MSVLFPHSKQHKIILSLAWPMIVSNVSIPLLGIVDTAILGHLDTPLYLGAVAIGASIMAFIFWGLGFLRMGTTAATAQAVGREDHHSIAHTLAHSVILAFILGCLLIALRQPLTQLAIYLINPSLELQALALSYCRIRLWGAPAMLISLVTIGWFIGQQNTRIPLLIVVTTNIANIIFDLVLILGLDMNSDGAAIATVCADYLGCTLACVIIWRRYRAALKVIVIAQLLRIHHYRLLLQLNSHLFLRTQLLLFVFAFFTAQGAQMGDDILAANAIIFQMLLLVSYGLDGFAHASEALVGKAFGAKDGRQLTAVIAITGLWSLIISAAMSLAFWLFEPSIIDLFTDIESVRLQLQRYYPWILLLPLLSTCGYWLDGVYIGAGASRDMLYSMLFSVAVIFLPCWYLTQGFSNHGLWFSCTLFNLARGLTLALRLKHAIPLAKLDAPGIN